MRSKQQSNTISGVDFTDASRFIQFGVSRHEHSGLSAHPLTKPCAEARFAVLRQYWVRRAIGRIRPETSMQPTCLEFGMGYGI